MGICDLIKLTSKRPPSTDQQHSESSKPKKHFIRKCNFPDVRQVETNTNTNTNTNSNSNSNSNSRMAEKLKTLVRFGPAYGEDTDANKQAKEEVWKRLEKKDRKSCLKSLTGIEVKVWDCYDNSIVGELNKKHPKWKREFWCRMAMDGYFFLLLSLHILGSWEILGHRSQHPYFGKDADSISWIPAMFFVGNQIPYIVIEALMEQPFLEKMIKDKTWKRPDGDLAKLALYETVIQPQLDKKKKKIIFPAGKQAPPNKTPPSDVLEALRNVHLGSSSDNNPNHSEMREFHDLEAGTHGTDDPIPGAGELYKKGIKLVKGELGITNIRFVNWGYAAFLYVPPFTVNAHTEVLLTSLAKVEQQLNESERELTSYLRFMRDLARTYKDFKILERKGIITVEKEELKGTKEHMDLKGTKEHMDLKGTMVHRLDTIVSTHPSNYTLNFRQIRHKIKDYGGPPWRLISLALGLLTFIQTIFTVLSYCFPPRA